MSVCPAIPEEAAASDCDEVFVIVHTNDVHGYIEVEPYVKAVADEMRAEYGNSNVITVSAGDVFSGGNAVAHGMPAGTVTYSVTVDTEQVP